MKINEDGMSLLEVLVAGSLLAGLGVAAMKLFQNMNTSQKTVEKNYEVTSTLQNIRDTLANTNNCAMTFAGVNPANGSVTTLKKDVNGAPLNYLPVNTNLPGSIKIYSYQLSRAFPGLLPNETLLMISFSRGTNTLKDQIQKNVKLTYTTTALGNIQTCSATSSGGGGGGSLWKESASNPDDIFYENGDVGIGTPDPTHTLSVHKTIGAVTQRFSVNLDTPQLVHLHSGVGNHLVLGTNSTERVRVDANSGNVGIGTTNTVERLHVKGSIYVEDNLPTDGGWLVGRRTTSAWGIAANTTTGDGSSIGLWGNSSPRPGAIELYSSGGSGYIDFGRNTGATSWENHMRITSNGNVGIGTTSPRAKLSVNGTGDFADHGATADSYGSVSVTNPATASIYAYYSMTRRSNQVFALGIDNNNGFVIGTQGVTTFASRTIDGPRFYISGGGDVGIGTMNPAHKLHVNGNVRANNVNVSSDRSLKEHIKTSPGLALINKLRGVTFNWKESGDESLGVIAQEVEAIIPAVVSTDRDGTKSVNYAALVAPLIESTKELHESISRQEKEIASLKALNALLLQRLNKLEGQMKKRP